MAIFKFRARHAETGEEIKALISLAGTDRGYTSDKKDQWLVVETTQKGPFEWYAKYGGYKIDSGKSLGGIVEVTYSPKK